MSSRSRRIVLSAPAKVNLYLGVHEGRDERGYHRVESLMVAHSLADKVQVEPAERLEVRCIPAVDFPQERNTAYKAAQLMGELAGREPAVCVTICKRVPEQSGMGGSSSDAAAVIRALCQLWDLDSTSPEVRDVASRVGADVPFFLDPVPTLLGGAGDVPEEAFPALDGVPLVLVRPYGPGVSTPACYQAFDEDPVPAAPLEPLREALRAGDVAAVAAHMANNLDPVACRLLPADAEVKAWLSARPGVLAAQVTGSGSCVFGICESVGAANRAVEAAQACGWWAKTAKTVSCAEQIC